MAEFNWAVSVERTQRLAAQIKRMQAQVRAERRRRLQQYGEFVERAGLTALTPAALFGLLLEGAQQMHQAVTVRRWRELGSHTLAMAAAPEQHAKGKAPEDEVDSQAPAVPVG